MFFVVDKPRLQRMIAIVREDRTPREQGYNAPFLRLKATGNELTVSSSTISATFPATVYEPGVLFIRTTKFRQVLQKTSIEERFLTFQFTKEGLRFCDVLFPFDMENMIYFPDISKAPESWPLTSPALEQIFTKKLTHQQLTMFGIENGSSQNEALLKYPVTEEEWPIFKAAKLMLHKILRSSEIGQKEVLDVCKVLSVFERLPETSEDLYLGVTLYGFTWQDEHDDDHGYGQWWRVEIVGKEIKIESWSGYTTAKMKDGLYSWSTLRIAPGWEVVEYNNFAEFDVWSMEPHSLVYDDVRLENYPEEMEGLDWSVKGHEFEIEDESMEKKN